MSRSSGACGRRQALGAVLAAATAIAWPLTAHAQGLSVVYEPTPHETVERMLNAGNVRASDFVIDLGSGDGRIAIAAARRGARALGVDLDPERVREANANAQRAGVSGRVSFRREDLFKTTLGEATVITMYLLPELNERLAPRLLALRPGTRVVSHRFPMGEWKPDATDSDGGAVYLWIVPARVAGRWQVLQQDRRFIVEFKQRYQELSGTASLGGTTLAVRDGRLRGDAITFALDVEGRTIRFSGTVSGENMRNASGGFGLGAGTTAWEARRM
jgi:SAM-dependent methyltransferase